MIIPTRFGDLRHHQMKYLAEKAGNLKAFEMLNNEGGFDNICKELKLSPAIYAQYKNKITELMNGDDNIASAKFIGDMRIFLSKVIVNWKNLDNTMD